MDHETNPYRDPTDGDGWTSPPPAGPDSRWKMPGVPRVPRVALTVGLTALLGMAGAGVAFAVGGSGGASNAAATASSQSSGSTGSGSTPAVPTPGGPRAHGPRGGWGPMGPGAGLGRVLHGTFTIRNGTTDQTVEMQVGTVKGTPGSTITVVSADGHTETYAVKSSTVVDAQSAGISTVQPGDTVRVQAVKQGSGFTATNIVDSTRIGASRKGFGFAPPAAPGTQAPRPGQSGTSGSGQSGAAA